MASILKHSKAHWMPSKVKYFFLGGNDCITLSKTCEVKVGFKTSYGFSEEIEKVLVNLAALFW